MTIENIKPDNYIKVSAKSITVLNADSGKTCGIIRGIQRFTDLQPNKAITFFRRVRESGLWCTEHMKRVYIINDDLVFFCDERDERAASGAAKYMTVICCHVV